MENSKAVAWTEKIMYIECPYCGYVEDCGSGAKLSTDDTHVCDKCGKTSEIEDCTD